MKSCAYVTFFHNYNFVEMCILLLTELKVRHTLKPCQGWGHRICLRTSLPDQGGINKLAMTLDISYTSVLMREHGDASYPYPWDTKCTKIVLKVVS